MTPARVVSDTLVMTRRNLLKYPRVPSLLVFSSVQPVMFVLLFAFVFGGAIEIPGVSYVDFLIPGILVQTAIFGATQTGIGLAQDLAGGMVDRFRSLPMARIAVVLGRTLSDACRNVFVVLLITGVGAAIGFRLHAGVSRALLGLLVAVTFGFAFSWVSAWIGVSVRDVETAQAAGFLWIFPLTFASSAFVPVQTMPGWLQAFAEGNPVTHTVDALRALVLGGPFGGPVLASLAWSAAILLVFVPLAVRGYRRAS